MAIIENSFIICNLIETTHWQAKHSDVSIWSHFDMPFYYIFMIIFSTHQFCSTRLELGVEFLPGDFLCRSFITGIIIDIWFRFAFFCIFRILCHFNWPPRLRGWQLLFLCFNFAKHPLHNNPWNVALVRRTNILQLNLCAVLLYSPADVCLNASKTDILTTETTPHQFC